MSGMRPVVGIVCCNREVAGEAAQAVMNRYVAAATAGATADAVLLPVLPGSGDAANLVSRIDGVLLTGSRSNVGAGAGGVAGGAGPFDAARDARVMRLLDAAASLGCPVFGICRGMQEINVALGGTLRGDLAASDLPHHADSDDAATMFDHGHAVSLTLGGVLAGAFGTDRLLVSSVHYQGVATLAPSLAVEAHADDGLVEAVSAERGGAPWLAVQWHPEWRTFDHPDRQGFFALLGRALRGASLPELRHAP